MVRWQLHVGPRTKVVPRPKWEGQVSFMVAKGEYEEGHAYSRTSQPPRFTPLTTACACPAKAARAASGSQLAARNMIRKRRREAKERQY